VCSCYGVVWLGWCGICMQAEACIRIPHQSNTTHEITQQISRKLLRMDVLTSETCWALNNEIIKQVTSSWSLYSNIKMMHGPINIDTFCVQYIFLSCRLWDNVGGVGVGEVQLGRPQLTIWRIRIACWITKAINTHPQYVTLIAFPLQQWLHKRASMLRYTHNAWRFLNVFAPCIVIQLYNIKQQNAHFLN